MTLQARAVRAVVRTEPVEAPSKGLIRQTNVALILLGA
jgi:hypothetical protein